MDYNLIIKDDESCEPVASGAFDDDFAAEKWAREWAQKNAQLHDYLIEREDGGLSSLLFRTHAGQWFIMRR